MSLIFFIPILGEFISSIAPEKYQVYHQLTPSMCLKSPVFVGPLTPPFALLAWMAAWTSQGPAWPSCRTSLEFIAAVKADTDVTDLTPGDGHGPWQK